jgi:hypothetical protein
MSLTYDQHRIAAAYPEISWLTAHHLCIYRPAGPLDADKIARLVAWLGEIEGDSEHPFNRFTDLTKVGATEISRMDLANVAFWRRANYEGEIVRSAFLAQSDECYDFAMMYKKFMEGSRILVSVFRGAQEAAAWLQVSPGSLEVVPERV